jgi:hypothetical protein
VRLISLAVRRAAAGLPPAVMGFAQISVHLAEQLAASPDIFAKVGASSFRRRQESCVRLKKEGAMKVGARDSR